MQGRAYLAEFSLGYLGYQKAGSLGPSPNPHIRGLYSGDVTTILEQAYSSRSSESNFPIFNLEVKAGRLGGCRDGT